MESKLHISVGLPGSGKTTLFKELSKANRNANHIECDTYLRVRNRYKNMEELIRDRSAIFYDETYLDGLFLTKKDIAKVIEIAQDRGRTPDKIIIHYWTPNVEACIWNDRGRRDEESDITIENAIIDTIDEIMSLEFGNIKFEKQVYSVKRKPEWRVFADENDLYVEESGVLKGDSWCLGGSWRDCWDNTGTVSPSSAPDGMRELDSLLEKIAPSISFLQYKSILNECVSIVEFSDGDYYGGTTYHNRYEMNIPRLYEFLVEKSIIESY